MPVNRFGNGDAGFFLLKSVLRPETFFRVVRGGGDISLTNEIDYSIS